MWILENKGFQDLIIQKAHEAIVSPLKYKGELEIAAKRVL